MTTCRYLLFSPDILKCHQLNLYVKQRDQFWLGFGSTWGDISDFSFDFIRLYIEILQICIRFLTSQTSFWWPFLSSVTPPGAEAMSGFSITKKIPVPWNPTIPLNMLGFQEIEKQSIFNFTFLCLLWVRST